MIAVLGSVNMDLVMRVPRFPSPGETLAGSSVSYFPGGKGANQAVAAAKLGADVQFFGCVGDDAFGDQLLVALEDVGVCTKAVERVSKCASGLASIWVNEAGENAIALAPGANGCVDGAYLERHIESIALADILLLQLEIPISTIVVLLRQLPADAPIVILDPAPAQDLSGLPLERVDLLTPNEHELRSSSGHQEIDVGAFSLLDRGVKHVIATLGSHGATSFSADGSISHHAAPDVEVVDTTAAGDAFSGALAWALLTHPLDDAVSQAVIAGALATTKPGAQPSLPTLQELREAEIRDA